MKTSQTSFQCSGEFPRDSCSLPGACWDLLSAEQCWCDGDSPSSFQHHVESLRRDLVSFLRKKVFRGENCALRAVLSSVIPLCSLFPAILQQHHGDSPEDSQESRTGAGCWQEERPVPPAHHIAWIPAFPSGSASCSRPPSICENKQQEK